MADPAADGGAAPGTAAPGAGSAAGCAWGSMAMVMASVMAATSSPQSLWFDDSWRAPRVPRASRRVTSPRSRSLPSRRMLATSVRAAVSRNGS
ncbi:MAG: hypothetical protein WKG00_01705 [Polyangiaceae bacterium]